MSVVMVRPFDQNATGKIGEASPAGKTQGKAAQRSIDNHLGCFNIRQ